MVKSLVLAAVAAGLTVSACSSGSVFRSRDQLVAETPACGPKRFDVYFGENSDRLTEAARSAIGLTATQLQGCRIDAVQVLGLASATGGADANLDLSQRRAVAVAEALAAAGWPAPVFEVAAAGDTGAVAANGVNEPLRRRTEVVVQATAL